MGFKIKSPYMAFYDVIEDIDGCDIVCTEFINDRYIYEIECRDYFTEVSAKARIKAYCANIVYLNQCLRLDFVKE